MGSDRICGNSLRCLKNRDFPEKGKRPNYQELLSF
jgi:hypothetical protein